MGVLSLCVLVAGVAFAAGGYLGLIKGVERLDEPRTFETHPTYIYSAPLGGNEDSRRVIGTIFEGQNRKTASLSEMPPQLLNAVVAKEDERFREHAGVDLWGIMRALYVDIRAGEAVEGASTITQQYVRNAYLSQDMTITRKVKEALIALEVERNEDSKDQIIADYLNTVYFGNNAYGVEAAAETYFNKSVEDLSIAESATLVGLLWSPSTLGEDREGAGYQRDLVLGKMFDTGYITSEDYNAALEVPMPERLACEPADPVGVLRTRAHPRLRGVRPRGAHTDGTVRTPSLQGGLSVYTTIDLADQVAAHDIAYGPVGYLPDVDDPDLALVSIEPGTGKHKDHDRRQERELPVQPRHPGQAPARQLVQAVRPHRRPGAGHRSRTPSTSRRVRSTRSTSAWTSRRRGRYRTTTGSCAVRSASKEALWWSDNTVFADLAMNADGRGLKNGPEKIADVAKEMRHHREPSRASQPVDRPRRVRGLAAGHGLSLRHHRQRGTKGRTDGDLQGR